VGLCSKKRKKGQKVVSMVAISGKCTRTLILDNAHEPALVIACCIFCEVRGAGERDREVPGHLQVCPGLYPEEQGRGSVSGMCVCVCVYVHKLYVHVYAYMNMYVYMHTYVCICIHTYIYDIYVHSAKPIICIRYI